MTTPYLRKTGKPTGPRFNQHPLAGRRRAAQPSEDSSRPAEVLKRDLRALEALQEKRPLRPPVGKR